MNTLEAIDTLTETRFATHPFSFGVTKANAEEVLGNYLAMSQAFPYLLAGSQGTLIMGVIEQGLDVSQQVELTSVVGNFLSWDETGGHAMLMSKGMRGLPSILHTQENFHSNHLKRDIYTLLKKKVLPSYSIVTRRYLKALFLGLSAEEDLKRLAHLVSFEQHAEKMIDALWQSLSDHFSIAKDDLSYFALHLGGDDPAEAYHVEMTRLLVEQLVRDERDLSRFLAHFVEAYALNVNWCEAIKH